MKDRVINGIIDREGGYCNDAADSGGETCYGITAPVARAAGYTGPMRDLPRAIAFEIYARQYWDAVRGDDLIRLSPAVAAEVVDTAVNAGPAVAGKFLQRALNAFNIAASLYPDLKIDGAIGPATIAALDAYCRRRSPRELVKALNCLQGAYYLELCERREKDEKFFYGWISNRVAL